ERRPALHQYLPPDRYRRLALRRARDSPPEHQRRGCGHRQLRQDELELELRRVGHVTKGGGRRRAAGCPLLLGRPRISTSKPRRRPPALILKRVLRAVSTGRGDGAFMEPRGCNGWQSAANRMRAEAAKTSRNRCRGLRPVACEVPW